MMGSDSGSDPEKPVHKVTFDETFWMSRTEITFDQYFAYVRDKGRRLPDHNNWGGGSRPVIKLTWSEAKGYANWLTSHNDHALQCRLPSEAEWEYAARAGSNRNYPWGDTASHEYANYGIREGKTNKGLVKGRDQWMVTAPVARFPANEWGLHDMHGNVWEWVEDTMQDDYTNAPSNGEAWVEAGDNKKRVIRGGSWDSTAYALRSTYRHSYPEDGTSSRLGFRVVCTAH